MRYLIIGFLLLLKLQAAFTAEAITLENAERIFIENNLELRAKKAELGRYDAALIETGLLPNPVFKYNIESVENGKRETEEVYSVSQPVDIVGKRGLRRDLAAKNREAEQLLYEQETRNALAELRKTYYRILLLIENRNAVGGILDAFADLRIKTEERLKAGDVAAVELLKLSSESNRILRALENLKAEVNIEKRRLALMLNMEMDEIALQNSFAPSGPVNSRAELISKALENRGDIRAASVRLDAAEYALALSRKEAVSPIEIEAGYKRLTGGFNGFVFGVSIPIPLFNKNQGGTAAAKTELETDRLKLEQLKRRTANEVAAHTAKAAFTDSRLAHLSEQLKAAEEIISSIRTAYDEGEASLIELLDAIRSRRELLMEYNETVYDYWATLFELEKITGMKLTGSGGRE